MKSMFQKLTQLNLTQCIVLSTLLLSNTFANAAGALPDWIIYGDKIPPLLKGPFTQEKKTPHLRRPIKSSGLLVLSIEDGLLWQTQYPVNSTLVLTADFIVSIDSDNKRKKISDGSELNMIFVNAMTGNWAMLQQHFVLTNSVIDARHCIELKPNTELTRKSLSHMEICGSQNTIETMKIEAPGGGITEIQLALKPYAKLSEFERNLFNHD